ncbi:MAG: hypothetical protein AAF664_12420 [Planctomycetota bacterium]
MTYARARLLLGMFGVGTIVLASAALLWLGIPLDVLPGSASWSSNDFTSLLMLVGILIAALFPLDFAGGFLLPNLWRPDSLSFGKFLAGWFRGAVSQAFLFTTISLFVLAWGRSAGLLGAMLAIGIVAFLLVSLQFPIARAVGGLRRLSTSDSTNVERAQAIVATWGWQSRPVAVLTHHDIGFTGGVVGLPGRETIVLPSAMLSSLSVDQLAIVIARRCEAIQSGSRTRGLILAFAWVVAGFALSAILPGAGVHSVAALTMTCLGFTLWTFAGLLTLPTLSRQASHAIDGKLVRSGIAFDDFERTLRTLDTWQDDEPRRSALIETIFHPVPSVENRRASVTVSSPVAWHAARMTLFVSWACMGMLVRAVHCNVGRPELWVLLPTD